MARKRAIRRARAEPRIPVLPATTDTTYSEFGYSVDLSEIPEAAILSILRDGRVVGEVAIGGFLSHEPRHVRVIFKRFQRGELPLLEVDDFE